MDLGMLLCFTIPTHRASFCGSKLSSFTSQIHLSNDCFLCIDVSKRFLKIYYSCSVWTTGVLHSKISLLKNVDYFPFNLVCSLEACSENVLFTGEGYILHWTCGVLLILIFIFYFIIYNYLFICIFIIIFILLFMRFTWKPFCCKLSISISFSH